jgi:hypothetical protein
MESNDAAHAMFDTLLEIYIFYISPMYEFLHSQGHFRPRQSRQQVPLCRLAPESGSKIRVLASCRDRPLWVDGIARRVIQAPKPEPRIMRYELTDYEWAAIKPFLPNKPRGVPRGRLGRDYERAGRHA